MGDSTLNLPFAKKKNKERRITFRITEELSEQLEEIARLNNISLSSLIEGMLNNEVLDIKQTRNRAKYLNTVSPRLEDGLLRIEKILPACFRQFTNARKIYPDAGKYSQLEMDMLTMEVLKDNGMISETERKKLVEEALSSILVRETLKADANE